MPHYNRVTLIGNVVRDPEIRYVASGSAVATFTLAVSRKNKEPEACDYIDVVAWNKLAETSNTYLKKGTLVLIEGRLAVRSYESKGGERHKVAEIVISLLQMLGKRRKPADADAESAAESTSA